MDWLSGLPIGQLTAGAILAILVMLILYGKMPTPGQYREMRSDRDYWRSSADTWQRVATEHGMTLEKHTETLTKLLDGQSAIRHVVEEIKRADESRAQWQIARERNHVAEAVVESILRRVQQP